MAFTFAQPIANPRLNGSNVSLGEGEHDVDYTQVPLYWFSANNFRNLEWNGLPIFLPTDPHGVLLSLRGRDRPTTMQVDTREGRVQSKPTNWLTSFEKGAMVVRNTQGHEASIGGPNATGTSDSGTFCKWRVNMHSQLPAAFVTFIQRRQDQWIHWRISVIGGKTMTKAIYHDFQACMTGSIGVSIPPEYTDAQNEGRLFAITIIFGDATHDVHVQHGNRSTDDRDRWESNQAMAAFFNANPRTEVGSPDFMVQQLFASPGIQCTFFREVHAQKLEYRRRFDVELRYWELVMNFAIEYGNYWFYRMQPQVVGTTPPVPFWLVTKFKAHVNRDGFLTKLIPIAINNQQVPVPQAYGQHVPTPPYPPVMQAIRGDRD